MMTQYRKRVKRGAKMSKLCTRTIIGMGDSNMASIFTLDVILINYAWNDDSLSILLSCCLTLLWQAVIILWIINEDNVKSKNGCHIWIPHPNYGPRSKFHPIFMLFDIVLTSCHHFIISCIINEDNVKDENGWHIWIPHPNYSPKNNFQPSLRLFDIVLTSCHHFMNN